MTQLSINIVAFDIPYPANYGGIIDVFYKIKALHKQGVLVYLHCFQYNKLQQKELEQYCSKVYYYKRKRGLKYMFSELPYIVATRNSKQLLSNLLLNNAPILFEGLHSCYFLNAAQLQARQKIVRTHNIEHHYYEGLQNASQNPVKKLYYFLEKKKLENFENTLKHANLLLTISENDDRYFSAKFENTIHIPAFIPFEEVQTQEGSGDYFLFHGNLSVEENQKAVQFLIRSIFAQLNYKLIVAGKNPSNKLQKEIARTKNIELLANPSSKQMEDLIKNAHACVLPSFQSTGVKLKLLYSLFSGRHVIVNKQMLSDSKLNDLCVPANTDKEFQHKIEGIKLLRFTKQQIEHRKTVLLGYTSTESANKLVEQLKNNA